MKFSIGRIQLKIHLLLPILWLLYFLSGKGSNLIASFLALSLHECGHLILAHIFRVPVQSLEIAPHGGLITISHLESASRKELFLISAAGPIFSLLGCIGTIYLYGAGLANFIFAQNFFQCNLLLFTINLMPILPLDGGKMLQAYLAHFVSMQRASRLLIRAGYGFGILLICISFFCACRGALILSPAFIGIYLIYSTAKEERNEITCYMNGLISRRTKLDRFQTIPLECIAVSGKMTVHVLIGKLSQGKFHRITVLSPDGMGISGILQDKDIYNCIFSQDAHITLSEYLQKEKEAHYGAS